MNTKHRWYDVIVAWANGEKIQFNFNGQGWKDSVKSWGNDMPGFNNNNTEWRIKPKTVTKKYRMAHIKTDAYEGCTCVEITKDTCPPIYRIDGFIRWVGDIAEIEVEV